MLATLPLLLSAAAPQAIALADKSAVASRSAHDRAAGRPASRAQRRRRHRHHRAPPRGAAAGRADRGLGARAANDLEHRRVQRQPAPELQPSLQFYSSNPRNSAINIRGLGAPFGLTNDGIEQGVGLYIDQVYIGRVGASTFDFVDVERVEVLRGPQGTLYGKNTTAGAVNITTKKPSFEPEATFEVSAGNYGLFQVKASASAPIATDTLAVRVSTSLTQARWHDLRRRARTRTFRNKTISAFAGSCCGRRRRTSTSASPPISTCRTPIAACNITRAPARRNAR